MDSSDTLKSSIRERSTAVDVAVQSLYLDILQGIYPPGTFLRLKDVATDLKMSMMPVRQAFRELASLGIVEVIPHRGAQVRELSSADLIETYRSRIYLESLAVKLGTPEFTTEQASQAREANARRIAAVQQGATLESIRAHEDFHFKLYESCGNPWIMRAILPGWRNSERYRGFSMVSMKGLDMLDAEHELMVEAMESHDVARAITILHHHLSSAAGVVAEELGESSIIDRLPTVEELL